VCLGWPKWRLACVVSMESAGYLDGDVVLVFIGHPRGRSDAR
jgi:hypothetical protein